MAGEYSTVFDNFSEHFTSSEPAGGCLLRVEYRIKLKIVAMVLAEESKHRYSHVQQELLISTGIEEEHFVIEKDLLQVENKDGEETQNPCETSANTNFTQHQMKTAFKDAKCLFDFHGACKKCIKATRQIAHDLLLDLPHTLPVLCP
uniref:Uncharacterized protein n=1 Tax=Romanomermis culicivorax TaxID=13658 RepID=A0A915HHP3_ROMCU